MQLRKQEQRFELNRPALFEAAEKKAGHGDWGAMDFEDGLDILLESLKSEANLSRQGRINHWNAIHALLTQRLQLNRIAYQQVSTDPADRPAFIIAGLPRTGSTLLQRLLALDEGADYLRWVDVVAPYPAVPPGSRKDRAKMALLRRATQGLPEGLKRIHMVDLAQPEEELFLLDFTFCSLLRLVNAQIPSYLNWFLEKVDPDYAYRELKQLLAYIGQFRTGSHWVLKTPQHQLFLPSLLRQFPNANIIWTHRSPLDIIPSSCSLYATMRQDNSETLNLHTLGREVQRLTTESLRRGIRAREANPARLFSDVYYEDLVLDPLGVVRKIYRDFGVDFPESMPEAINSYMARNRLGKYGKHHYTLEKFGLTREEILESLTFYTDRYEI